VDWTYPVQDRIYLVGRGEFLRPKVLNLGAQCTIKEEILDQIRDDQLPKRTVLGAFN
jgi:hypothetical protein